MALAYPTFASGIKLDSGKFSVEIEDNALRQEVEGGYAYTRPRTTRRARKTFKCAYSHMTNADKATLEAFYQSTAGGSRAVDWVSPQDSVTYTVRFKGPISFTYIGAGAYQRWDCSFDFEEV